MLMLALVQETTLAQPSMGVHDAAGGGAGAGCRLIAPGATETGAGGTVIGGAGNQIGAVVAGRAVLIGGVGARQTSGATVDYGAGGAGAVGAAAQAAL